MSNLGQSTFSWGEGNGKTAANQVQTTVSKQPYLISNNGHQQFRYEGSSGLASVTRTAAALQAGWTGATMIAGWFRWPVTMTTGVGRYLVHFTSTVGQRILGTQTPSGVSMGLSLAASGAIAAYNWPTVATPTLFHYYEFVFDPSLAATLRGALYFDRVLQSPTAPPSGPASIFDANSFVEASGYGGVAGSFTGDRGPVYYTNGIPSDADRDLMMTYKAPV